MSLTQDFDGDKKADSLEIERAVQEDYGGILDLQSRYFIASLGPDERGDGFLSAEFTLSQVSAMAEDLGIVVARSQRRIIGYVCASRVDLIPRPPIVDAMMRSLEHVVFRGSPLLQQPMFIYGPVCVDAAFRGKGVLKRLFECLKSLVADRFSVGVAFVAVDNPRSFAAHTRGLGMAEVGAFSFGESKYHVVAFALQ
jgi:predicted N-acetyltransferase YhbS